ncbi:hypothetical protein AGABI2DRAFT_120883 [Agaricus bisporus var. bisporus H97]|uniref:hypothetical protein n=1 Tax=Agaricus bisporus var. bisporus (strain H97 / ATCC MYA-4626 / FGSC 10389) TaxID=936046 RepID=UPI00029F73EA|nr:hypothetical protein AGABI2DRAFT_120883 [Agaricus bisporus var. bisporus H97]EKV44776.1 hypothetical protein AGABI2DRAFT_120883 [Agaricus bisporus var. bisporus H97]
MWFCAACAYSLPRALSAALCHQQSKSHQTKAQAYLQARTRSEPDEPLAPVPFAPMVTDSSRVPSATINTVDFDALATDFDAHLDYPLNHLAQMDLDLNRWLEDDVVSRASSSGSSSYNPAECTVDDDPDPLIFGSTRSRRKADIVPTDSPWFPWSDKETCVLDVLRHLPRSVFSDSQVERILWGMNALGVNFLPSVIQLKDSNVHLQNTHGIRTIRYEGKLTISVELANPRICPHLHFYPEDSHPHLEEAWQAHRWSCELDPALLTPMIRYQSQDFYVFEPALLKNGRVVIPERWFTRRINDVHQFFALAYSLVPMYSATEDLLLSFPTLRDTFVADGLPDPRLILGVRHSQDDVGLSPWTLTDPTVGNRYRALAKGHCVVSFLIWLYCDDTSGNLSKKWNKHNSFLFTAAGLPRAMTQQEFNVHFLSTSNIAPPLEMLDGIVEQLENSHIHGIWAWDCDLQEIVMIFIVVLAMLGDNPMQSELACHIGLKGKYFCQNCWVRGHDTEDRITLPSNFPSTSTTVVGGVNNTEGVPASPISHAGTPDSHGSVDSHQSISKKTRRPQETLQIMVNRVHWFLGVSSPHRKDETIEHLSSMFNEAVNVGTSTKYKLAKTNTGLKDNFLEFFINKIHAVRGAAADREAAVHQTLENVPPVPFSPVWWIKGLDPHQDTPVEILHVFLLGFIKYLWRDAVTRINDKEKKLLVVRLNSTDVSGLGISPLAGQRLVQYAGSLTGADFCVISQVAPFVLHGLPSITPKIYDTNGAPDLATADHGHCNPSANSSSGYSVLPLMHGPLDPTMVQQTQVSHYPTFTASLIRSHSVHSNRQAPSRDIARGLAQFNRIRHILSGGFFLVHSDEIIDVSETGPTDWHTAQMAPLMLVTPHVSHRNIVAEDLGLIPPARKVESGPSFLDNSASLVINDLSGHAEKVLGSGKKWRETAAGLANIPVSGDVYDATFRQYHAVYADNGDKCIQGSFILVRSNPPIIARLREILQIIRPVGSPQADLALIDRFSIVSISRHYQLPQIQFHCVSVISPKDILCTVNFQHNCSAHGCTTEEMLVVYQEREGTSQRQAAIRHRVPDNLILNTSQMRDATLLAQFRLQPAPLDRNEAILEGARFEIDMRKSKTKPSRPEPRSRPTSQASQVLATETFVPTPTESSVSWPSCFAVHFPNHPPTFPTHRKMPLFYSPPPPSPPHSPVRYNPPRNAPSIDTDYTISQDTSQLHIFCNLVSNKYKLSSEQRIDLKSLIEAFPSMSLAYVRTLILQLAISFANINSNEAVHAEYRQLQPTLNALRNRFVVHFELTNAQKDQIISVCKDKVFDYRRTAYKDALTQDAEDYICRNATILGFLTITGNTTYEHTLHSVCRVKASAARNQFRQLVVKSIAKGQSMPLDRATVFCAEKLKSGGIGSQPLRVEYQFRIVMISTV